MAEFTGPELCKLTALQIRDMLQAGEISQSEVLEASLTRIGQTEPMQNAMVTRCADRARASRTNTNSILAGMPIGIKDLMPVAGVRTTFGTAGMADNIPSESAALVTRLEQNGAIVMGKTNTPEMGAGGNTFNAVFGATGNPYDPSRVAGGSSGGAASSLATGQVWLSHGSDYGGSLRTPAAYCGVVGLRPSPGRAGGAGNLAFATEGVQGPMARNVTDCALFLDAMVGLDPFSPISIVPPLHSFLDATLAPPDKIRVAWSSDLGGHATVENNVAELLIGAMEKISGFGNIVEEIDLNSSGLDACFRSLRGIEFLAAFNAMPTEITQHFKATIQQNTEDGRNISGEDMANAAITRSRLFNDVNGLLQDFDILACPVVGISAMPLGDEYPANIAGIASTDYLDWLKFSNLATVTNLPALSLPIGLLPNGIPMGIQLIGANRAEAKLLATARLIEQILMVNLAPIDLN